MNYRDLLAILPTLTDEQLDQEIQVLTEGPSVSVGALWVLEEDHINPTGECVEPVSAYKDEPAYTSEPVVARKGDVFLMGGQNE